MTKTQTFKALSIGGAYTLPYLITIHHPKVGTAHYINNNEDVTYHGVTYEASAFKYSRPKTVGGVLQNGTLEITGIKTCAIDIVEASDELFTVDVIGVLDAAGDISPIKYFHHQYGSISTDNGLKVVISFTNDDRLDMNFPPYIFDADNNRGNA